MDKARDGGGFSYRLMNRGIVCCTLLWSITSMAACHQAPCSEFIAELCAVQFACPDLDWDMGYADEDKCIQGWEETGMYTCPPGAVSVDDCVFLSDEECEQLLLLTSADNCALPFGPPDISDDDTAGDDDAG